MLRIALTGGIACGKSLVARYLNELGVETIDADDVVHELMPDPAERRRIAAEVFADPEKRRALEARLHPIVKARISEWLDEGGDGVRGERDARDKRPLVSHVAHVSQVKYRVSHVKPGDRALRIAVIPLLFEAHWDGEYDIICCVRSRRATQIARMAETRGYSREEAEARLAAQLPVEEKAAKSHYVIDNDGTKEQLKAQTAGFVEWLKARI